MRALLLAVLLQSDPTLEGLYRLDQRLAGLQAQLDAARADAQARDNAEAARRAAATARAEALAEAVSALQSLRPDVLFASGDWERALGRARAALEQAETLGPAPTLARARAAVAQAEVAVSQKDLSAAWAWAQEAAAWAAQTPR
jgi:multidrug resistance efflux pump